MVDESRKARCTHTTRLARTLEVKELQGLRGEQVPCNTSFRRTDWIEQYRRDQNSSYHRYRSQASQVPLDAVRINTLKTNYLAAFFAAAAALSSSPIQFYEWN